MLLYSTAIKNPFVFTHRCFFPFLNMAITLEIMAHFESCRYPYPASDCGSVQQAKYHRSSL